MSTKTPEQKLAARLKALMAMLGSNNEGERENARTLIDGILLKQKKTWNDLVELIQTGDASGWDVRDERAKPGAASVPGAEPASGTRVTALDLVDHMLRSYVSMEPHEYVATALWVLHTHVYDRFMISPRLAATSPVRGCGKTTLLDVIQRMGARTRSTGGISAAAIYRLVDRDRCTLLVDEADNLGLHVDGPLRATLNSGHRKGGKIVRAWKDTTKEYSVFCPMAIAAIGHLPLPISQRSVTIRMTRYGGTEPLRRFDDSDTEDLDITYQMIWQWMYKTKEKLKSDPEMPDVLRNRQADNWRPLIAIADTFGPYWANAARNAAMVFARSHSDEDLAVVLLCDIRDLFDAHAVDRFASATLASALCAMDGGPWAEWRGIRGDQAPRHFSQGELARLLAPFGIRPRSIWPLRRVERGVKNSAKGYLRSQFESAWQSYCTEAGTPAQPTTVRHLRQR